jgi:hypothetical protein
LVITRGMALWRSTITWVTASRFTLSTSSYARSHDPARMTPTPPSISGTSNIALCWPVTRAVQLVSHACAGGCASSAAASSSHAPPQPPGAPPTGPGAPSARAGRASAPAADRPAWRRKVRREGGVVGDMGGVSGGTESGNP